VRVAAAEDEEAVIVVLRDAKILELRLHEAKLAAMGRLVAAIAHEVRNPLSAVTQAAELLRETTTGGQARLTQLILTNSARINSTVEDVLALGRRERTSAPPLALRTWLVEWLNEQHAGDTSGRLVCLADELERGDFAVEFQPEHLRRVLNNLLENALRYCSRDAGAVVLRLAWQRTESSASTAIEAELVLVNDGGIIAELERANLFEPFNSSEARGTGLGLYISRELCAKNGASLNYRVAYSGKSEFVIRVPVMQAVETHV
jgi:two-component system, NtrC family, sensor histidine kinase PilS